MSLSATQRQDELLALLKARQAEGGQMPSFDEMKNALGLKTKSGISRLLDRLEDRGLVRRLKQRRRCIEVIEPSDAAEALRARLIEKLRTLPEGHFFSKSEVIRLIQGAA